MTTAASAAALNLFIPITKIDAAKRLVYGIATAEKLDRSGEVCDYETTKPYYEKWSADMNKASGGKSLGNLRAMHGKVAAGLLTAINFNDTDKQIEICSKVVDDNEWKKVEEGVYTGFSQGGAYVKRWKDGDVQKYTADPSEVSLVDLPCLPEATFEVIKADGSSELRKFVTVQPELKLPSNDEVFAKAKELAKAAGDEGKFGDFIAPAREDLTKALNPAEKAADAPVAEATTTAPVVEKSAPEAAAVKPEDAQPEWEQVWKSGRSGQTFKAKADLIKHHADLDAADAAAKAATPVQAALADLSKTLGIEKAAAKPGATDASGAADATAADQGKDPVTGDKKKKTKKFETAEALQKGLGSIGRLACLIQELEWLQQDAEYERSYEGDGSTVPDQLKSNVAALCQSLRDMVTEETAELFDADNENEVLLIQVLEMAAGVPADAINALVKLADHETMAKSKDAIVKAGECFAKAHPAVVEPVAAPDLTKQADDLQKAIARGDAMQKVIDDLMPQIDEIKKSVDLLLKQPAAHPATRVITKQQDNNAGDGVDAEALLKNMTPDQFATLAIKIAQQNGQPLITRGR